MIDTELIDETASRPSLSRLWLALGLGSLILLVAMTSLVAFNLADTGTGDSGLPTSEGAAGAHVLPRDILSPTVRVVGLGPNNEFICGGSGTIVTPTGQVLTSAKVVTASSSCSFQKLGVAVTTEAGQAPKLAYEAELLSSDSALDLAVVRIVRHIGDSATLTEQFSAPTLGNSDEVEENDRIQLTGFPLEDDKPQQAIQALVTGFAQWSGVPDALILQTDSESIPGFAGATATDSSGRVIGVVGSSTTGGDSCLDLPEPIGGAVTDSTGGLAPTDGTAGIDGVVPVPNCQKRDDAVNIVRPINLALSIVEEAEGAKPIEVRTANVDQDLSELSFSNPRFSTGESDNRPTKVVKTATAGAKELCLFADWEGMPEGISWDVIWYLDGSPKLDYSLRDEVWSTPSSGEDFWICAVDQEGLAAGLYEVGFFIGDENIFAEGFRLTTSESPVHEVTWINDVEGGKDICSLAINPRGSGPVGLNELDKGSSIKPGGSVTVEVAEGAIVAAADDCDGTRLAIQLDGLQVDGPKEYSIGIG